eukprot:CAMPEP_0117425718 /NCGR_PEP_ID=MMETSP0758-20121206/5968_1 /TAXON_ID=63605 /ORGANISM="Percolomonas cosmopolitus, Strain AE-1 (ATCC 50343)" /LENGTH=159 /DNA_ID=CAMNT_0005210439 /DNA_START=62 /DNA_END=537 /DNA_ORIENTATION=+
MKADLKEYAPSGFLTKQDLIKSLHLHVTNEKLIDSLIIAFDKSGDNKVSIKEYLSGMLQFRYGTPHERFNLAFKVFDVDEDNNWDYDELKLFFINVMDIDMSKKSKKFKEKLENHLEELYEKLDKNDDGYITRKEFTRVLAIDQNLTNNIMSMASFITA